MEIVKMYVSKDRQVFPTAAECAVYEGLVKCFCCKGTGNESYEHRTPYPEGLPDSGWVEDLIETRTRKCTRCDGTGYVEYNVEEDPEYALYLKLKRKFKD